MWEMLEWLILWNGWSKFYEKITIVSSLNDVRFSVER